MSVEVLEILGMTQTLPGENGCRAPSTTLPTPEFLQSGSFMIYMELSLPPKPGDDRRDEG